MKKIFKTLISLVLIGCMAVNTSAVANAEEKNNYIVAHTSEGNSIMLLPENTKETNNITRGKYLPTKLYDLSEDDYYADLQEVASAVWLYTNYFFYCSDDGKIYVKYRVKRNSNDRIKMRISVYDLTTDTSYDAFLTDYLPITSYLTDQMYFSGLTVDHQYAIRFKVYWEIDPSTITGEAYVGHDHITQAF